MPLSRFCKSAALSAAVLCGLGLASSANAQQSNVGSITIEQNINEWHQLAEVLAFETGTGTNVALQSEGGVATASSSGFSTNPAQANDGNTNGAYGGAGGSLWHSGVDPSTGPTAAVGQTWTVTFDTPAEISSVQVFGRTDCCQDRDRDLDLVLFDPSGTELQRIPFGIPDDDQEITIPITAIPEPASLGLLGLGGLGLLARRRRASR